MVSKQGWAQLAKEALKISVMIRERMWSDQTPLEHEHYMIFFIFFCGSMNSYEPLFVFFCIGEPEERVHKIKIIIFNFFFKFKLFRIHE